MKKISELTDKDIEQVSGGAIRKKKADEKRRADDMMEPCPQCGELRLKHRVCPNCGYYDGKEHIED